MPQEQHKRAAAQKAIEYIQPDSVVGVGTGSTVAFFIEALATIKGQIEGAVASSVATATLLRQHRIPVLDLNAVGTLPIYVDGTDEVNGLLQLIKGAGGALCREKILAAAAEQFICIADPSKQVLKLGAAAPLPVEVIPMARSFVARAMVKMGGQPIYREGFVSDNGNVILDVHQLNIIEPLALENQLNQIPGVVSHGLFAHRGADLLLLGDDDGVKTLTAL